jgi:hypothetical protein
MTQYPAPVQFELDTTSAAPASLGPIEVIVAVGLLVVAAYGWLTRAAADAEHRHNRAELLAAYRRRHQWKKSDTANLRTLDLSPVAERRIARLSGKGRPVVRPHQELAELWVGKIQYFMAVVSPETKPAERLRAIKQTPWGRHYVEALYRGEHALAKQRGEKGASEVAESLVAKRLIMSSAQVHRLCGEIRRVRAECFEDANFPPITLAKFDECMREGRDFDFSWETPAAGHAIEDLRKPKPAATPCSV